MTGPDAPVPESQVVPEPQAVPEPQTGDARVDAALAGLTDLAGTPLAEHPERLAEAHRVLQQILNQA